MTTFALIPQVHAVSNAAGTSHAVRDTTTNSLPNAGTDCTTDQCIVMSSDGVAGNDDHGVFVRSANADGGCYVPNGTHNGKYVEIDSAMTTTAILALTFFTSSNIDNSTLCNTAGSTPAGTPNTWHIFGTVSTTPDTIWAVKLDGSSNFPATLDATNFMECDPAGTFNTTTGCAAPAPTVSAPIFNLNTPAKIFATEVKE